jgi:hypothetical protein
MNVQYYRCFTLISLMLPLLMGASSSYAWGPLGHHTVCDVAWRHSSMEIKEQLSATAKRMGYKTFAESCTWADDIRGKAAYDHLKPLHYINVSRNAKRTAAASCLSTSKATCVVTAIDHYLAQLKKPSLSEKHHDQALLLLSHFVGDVHQPLHVSYADDRGGTRRKVVFSGKVVSLHRLWDSQLLYCQRVRGKTASWRRLGRYLSEDKPVGASVLSVVTWADESLSLTRQIYADIPNRGASREYCEHFHPVALERLQLAGWRLATLLAQTLVP